MKLTKNNLKNIIKEEYKLFLKEEDRRDAGQRTDLSVERQREICNSRAKRGARVHFNEKTKRCEYDYLDNPDDPRNLQENEFSVDGYYIHEFGAHYDGPFQTLEQAEAAGAKLPPYMSDLQIAYFKDGEMVPGTTEYLEESKRMKITREQLKYIIKEEIDKTIEEMFGSGRDGPRHPAAYAAQRRNQRPGPHPGGATAGARQRCAEKGGYFDQSKSARGICIDRKTGREIKEEQLEEAEDSASIRKKLKDLRSKANKTDSDYNRITNLEKKLSAKTGKRTRSQGIAYNPYDYEE